MPLGGTPARAALLLLHALVVATARVTLDTQPAGTQGQQAVTVVTELPGVTRALTEQDLKPLLDDNLEPDLAPWRKLGPLKALDVLDFINQIDTEWPSYRRNFVAIVAVRQGRWKWWAYPSARSWCTRRVATIKAELEGRFLNGTLAPALPDTVFIFNAYDKPLCAMPGARNTLLEPCSAPIFGFTKRWQPTPAAGQLKPEPQPSQGGQRAKRLQQGRQRAVKTGEGSLIGDAPPGSHSPHQDIMFPVMNHAFDHLVSYPWALKDHRALMRAGLYEAMDPDCQRVRLYKLGQSVEGKKWLDIGIYQNRHWKVKLNLADPIPMDDHAKWRYLVNSDGQSASWRLAKLLAIDSVVLKMRSQAIEHYYRSLKEGEHYLSVNETDLMSLLGELRTGRRDRELQRIAANAQAFAYRYLSQASRAAYGAVALSRYTQLFAEGEMKVLLDTLWPKETTVANGTSASGQQQVPAQHPPLNIPQLLRLRERLRAQANGNGTQPGNLPSGVHLVN